MRMQMQNDSTCLGDAGACGLRHRRHAQLSRACSAPRRQAPRAPAAHLGISHMAVYPPPQPATLYQAQANVPFVR